jgi:7,8-dihydro-6-hydroxymethylpterin-pyrophosphokinase
LRAVATVTERQAGRAIRDRHQVRVIDLDTLAMGAVLDVLPFGAHGVN